MNSGASADQSAYKKDALSYLLQCRSLAQAELAELLSSPPGLNERRPAYEILALFNERDAGLSEDADRMLRIFVYFWLHAETEGKAGYAASVRVAAGVKLISHLVQMFLDLDGSDDRQALFHFVKSGDLDPGLVSHWLKCCYGAMSEARVWYALRQLGWKRNVSKNSDLAASLSGADLIWVVNNTRIEIQVTTGACEGVRLLDVTDRECVIPDEFAKYEGKIENFRASVFARKTKHAAEVKRLRQGRYEHAQRLRRTAAVFLLVGAHGLEDGEIQVPGLKERLQKLHDEYAR